MKTEDAAGGVRERMLETAERLFAKEGVERVPLSRIVAESGQRNSSALHYHFGSRPEIVAHVINMRLPVVNAVRHRYFDALERRGKAGDLLEIIRASAGALADTVRDMAWGPRYALILAQANFTPDLCRLDLIEREHASSIARARALIEAAVRHVPADLLGERLLWMDDTIVMAIARLARGGQTALSANVVANLADFCAAAMAAPVTRQSRGARSEVPRVSTSSIARIYD